MPITEGASASTANTGPSLDHQADKEVLSDVFIPSILPELSAEDQHTQHYVIQCIKEFEGEPIAPDEEFFQRWEVLGVESQGLIDAGLIPSDSVSSAGLDNTSYRDFKMCADTLQSHLFEGDAFQALGNLRGFRRLFSNSANPILKHAFRGNPVEVLKNIYFGGNGVLPEDRMCRADPFHYSIIGNEDPCED